MLACLVLTGMVSYTKVDSESTFAAVCSSVLVSRYRLPETERGFRCPLMLVIPLIGVGSSIWLTTFLTLTTWERFGIWFLLGLVVYAAYGSRHSREHPAAEPAAARRDG